MTHIIETPFSYISAAFVVAFCDSATKVKIWPLFATGKSLMDFPCRFFIFVDAYIAFTSIPVIVISMLSDVRVVLAVFANRFCVAAPRDRFFISHIIAAPQ
ncbi:hypothetical protein SMZ56_001225 [Escherichia coli]|nr:hypothetical protein [Shigella sonnei]ELQ9858103.1 hypothetical protein [Escherichia coli]ELQ9911231.1 hypothetical protein [Escherichia coli]ELR3830547.1 hypothetical protein [Escherichia coli]ELT4070847.1 hypothetical protein [Escherichia coli]